MNWKKKHETVKNYLQAFQLVRRMLKEQWLSREQIEALQNIRLQKLIKHAYEKVPYYRRLFERAGITPEAIKTVKDLPKIPITSKADIRTLNPQDIISSDTEPARCYVKTTSGSIGIPLATFWDDYALTVYYSVCVRSHHLLNCKLMDKFLCIGPTYYPYNLLPQKLGICKVKMASPFSGPEEHIRLINSYRPDVLFCYPSVLKSLINFVRGKSHVKIYSPRLVTTSSEFLDAQTRAAAGLLLGSTPVQFYGSWEIGRIGNECVYRDGIHLNEDVIIPEFIPVYDGNSRKYHRIILTSLYNYAMPFIRYDQGDLVLPIHGDCDCGREFVRVKISDARAGDILYLPDGTTVSALHLTGIIFDLPGVNQFKIIQEAVNRLVIQIVKNEKYSDDAMGIAVKKIESLIPGIRTELSIVHHIDSDPSGKFRQFHSKITETSS